MKKKLTIKNSKLDEVRDTYTAFGFEETNCEEKNGKTSISFSFNPKQNKGKVKKLYKQFKKVNRAFPISACVIFALAIGALVAYFVMETFEFRDFIIAGSIALFFIGIVSLVVFFLIFFNKKKLTKDLVDAAGDLSGAKIVLPRKNNIHQDSDSGLLKDNLLKKDGKGK